MASKRGNSATSVADHRNVRASHRSIAKQLLAGTAMSLGAIMLFAPINAQAAQNAAKTEIAQANASFDFNIAAQNLNDALLAFAQQTGIQIFYDTAQVENLTSTAVTGTMTAAEALAKLLDGNDVKFSFTDDSSVTLVAGDDTVMDPVVVEAQASSNPGDAAATEGTGSFTTTVAGVGSKSNETIRELPQSVSVITSARMEEQNFQYLDDAMRYTTGVQVLANTSGRSSIASRGYETTTAQTNGLSVPISSREGTVPNLAMYDRIEVLRGAAGLYGGSGFPGATINMIRKQAKDEFTGSATVGYGSWNHYSALGDVSTPLTEDGSVRVRGVVSADYRDSFVDVEENNNELGYVTLDADISDDTFISLGLSHERKDQVPHNGLPANSDGTQLDVSRSTFAGASWNSFENTSSDLYFDLKHQFSSRTDGAVGFRFSDRDVDANYAYTNSAVDAAGTATYTGYEMHTDQQAFAVDAHVNHNFDLLGYEQTLTIGADANRFVTDSQQYRGTTYTGRYSISSPDLPYVQQPLNSDTKVTATQSGVYTKLKLQTFDDITFSFGGRTSWYNSVTENRRTSSETDLTEDAVFTPFAGIVYDVSNDFSTYFSYTSIFEPQDAQDSTGSQLKPRTGDQFEIGLKGEHFGGLLNSHLALFQIDDVNRAADDPDDAGTAKIASGEQRSRGIEAELSGAITPNLQAFVGYTLLYVTDQTKDDDATIRVNYAPRHRVTSWLDYGFDRGVLDGLSVGGGVTWSDDYWVSARNVEADAYYLVDGRIGYEVNENLEVALNINNILDEEYYERPGTTSTFNYYGAPRNFFLSVTGKF